MARNGGPIEIAVLLQPANVLTLKDLNEHVTSAVIANGVQCGDSEFRVHRATGGMLTESNQEIKGELHFSLSSLKTIYVDEGTPPPGPAASKSSAGGFGLYPSKAVHTLP
jgi:hypothetical protein